MTILQLALLFVILAIISALLTAVYGLDRASAARDKAPWRFMWLTLVLALIGIMLGAGAISKYEELARVESSRKRVGTTIEVECQ